MVKPTGGLRTTRPAADRRTDDDVRTKVWIALRALGSRGGHKDRRGKERFPYPYLVRLTPVADDGVTPQGDAVVVVGKHLSEEGLGFYHVGPLPYRRMIASLESAGGTRLDFLIDVTWCRFAKQGWYESGGRFLQSSPPPQPSRAAATPSKRAG
jgi:hypothetical protein